MGILCTAPGTRPSSKPQGQGGFPGSGGRERGGVPGGKGPRECHHSQAHSGGSQEGQEQEAGQRREDGGDNNHVTTPPPWPRVDGAWRLPCTHSDAQRLPWTPGPSPSPMLIPKAGLSPPRTSVHLRGASVPCSLDHPSLQPPPWSHLLGCSHQSAHPWHTQQRQT